MKQMTLSQMIKRGERFLERLPAEIQLTIGAGEGDLECRDLLTQVGQAYDEMLRRYPKR